jgi:hypothetical protein
MPAPVLHPTKPGPIACAVPVVSEVETTDNDFTATEEMEDVTTEEETE